MSPAAASPSRAADPGSRRTTKIARRVAAVAGAAGAAVAGQAGAAGVTYVPTAGVAAAQGIPGFSFASPTTVTSGTLRPPSTEGNTGWDVDGNNTTDFVLNNDNFSFASFLPQSPFASNPNGVLVDASLQNIRNLSNAAPVGPLATVWGNNGPWQFITNYGGIAQGLFTKDQPGYFGFRFAFGNSANNYYYGWASMTIDTLSDGQGFKITEAFYQTTPNTAINVGAVPVPEPSSMALLAAGAAGVTAWRARKKKQPAAE